MSAAKLLVLCAALFCSAAHAGFYVEGGYYYNPDAHGITSNHVGHVAIGYDKIITEQITLDFQARHESDPMNSGERDKISNESFGVIVRYRF